MKKGKERRVFKGVTFTAYQWRQQLYDGSWALFERIERPSVALFLPVVGKKVVMAIEEQPMFGRTPGMLGGVIEEGEKALDAAKRELLEEAGMTARKWKLIKEYRYTGRMLYTLHLFAAIDCRKVAEQKLDPGEKIEIRQVTLQKFLSMVKGMRLDDKIKLDFLEARYVPAKLKMLERMLGMRR